MSDERRGAQRRRREQDEDLYEYEYEYEDEYEPRARRRTTPPPASSSNPPRSRRDTRNIHNDREVRDRSAYTQPSRPPRPSHAPQPSQPMRAARPQYVPQRKRRVWPVLLAGCALGVVSTVLAAAIIVFLTIRSTQGGGLTTLPGIMGTTTFSQETTQDIPLTTISQIQVCDKVGNVVIKVDPTASKTTVLERKTVHASSKSAADLEFQRISVEVQPPATLIHPLACVKPWATPTATAAGASPVLPATPTSAIGAQIPTTPPPSSVSSSTVALSPNPATATPGPITSAALLTMQDPATALTVNVTFPDAYRVNDSVDVTINLPASVLPTTGPNMLLDVEAPLGNIAITGVSGILSVNGGTGDVTITHAILVDGSHLTTGQGTVTFNGLLDVPADPQKPARYVIQSEHGIDVTLPDNTNVVLDANTNVGTITSDFKINVTNGGSSGPVSYNGPLNIAATPTAPGAPNVPSASQPTSTLVLDVGTGNIAIHKARAQAAQ